MEVPPFSHLKTTLPAFTNHPWRGEHININFHNFQPISHIRSMKRLTVGFPNRRISIFYTTMAGYHIAIVLETETWVILAWCQEVSVSDFLWIDPNISYRYPQKKGMNSEAELCFFPIILVIKSNEKFSIKQQFYPFLLLF